MSAAAHTRRLAKLTHSPTREDDTLPLTPSNLEGELQHVRELPLGGEAANGLIC